MEELNPQELAVAKMAAAGSSNTAIARHLSVSLRTVDNLLYAVYAKFGVTSSLELAALLPM